jgi:hypothetical protein
MTETWLATSFGQYYGPAHPSTPAGESLWVILGYLYVFKELARSGWRG